MSRIGTPKLLVIVLNYRTAEMTLKAAAAALADMPKVGAELIIVDNASGDGSAVILQQAVADRGWGKGNHVRLILSEVNGGFGAGNNLALCAGMSDGSKPDFYYIVNSDAFVDPGCIATLTAFLQDHPKAGIAGSHVRGDDDAPHCTAFRFPSIAGEFEGAARTGVFSKIFRKAIVAPPLPTQTTQVDWVAGASVLMRAQMLDEIGLFDEEFFLYFEETDLCKRAARSGWQCWYVPESRVVHIGSVSTGMKEWQRMPSYWFASRQRYFLKNHGRVYAVLAWVARLSGGVIHQLRCVISGRKPQEAPYFQRDLLRHGLGLGRANVKPMTERPVTEE